MHLKRALNLAIVHTRLSVLRKLGVRHVHHRLHNGDVMRLRTNDELAVGLLLDPLFEREIQDFVKKHVLQGMTVLDIGANVGFFSSVMSRLVGPSGGVIAFEPNPLVCEELRGNLALNGITNVQVKECALSDRVGFADFCVPQPGREAHGSLQSNSSFETLKTVRVVTQTVDGISTEESWGRIGFVKMDVEGAELHVLRGASRLLSEEPKPRFVFEASELLCQAFGYDVFDLLAEFRSKGFRLREICYGAWTAEPE